MTDGEKRRHTIFDRYSRNLNLAASLGIVDPQYKNQNVYICPLCKQVFTTVSYSGNPLTLEDAPPKSLGGKAHTLTCKSCNNAAGTKIDYHLAERLNEIDSYKFLPGSELKASIKIGDDTFRSTIRVDEKKIMTVEHSLKHNNPAKLEAAMKKLTKGTIIDLEYLKSRVIPENFESSLLKTGYILAFRKFGYALMLDPCYDIVREQIADPSASIYPSGFWFYPPSEDVREGTFFAQDKGFECLMSIFSVHTDLVKHTFITVLPLPGIPINKVIENLRNRFEVEKKFTLNMYDHEFPKILEDPANLKQMWKWINERKS